MNKNITILGIDPGSRKTGFGLIQIHNNSSKYLTSGIIKSMKGSFPQRLKIIFESMHKITEDYMPDVVAVESVFMHKNAASALKLGQARAAAICGVFGQEPEVFEYSPREIKQAVVGSGAATKDQVKHMVEHLLNLDGNLHEDASDALGAALCYASNSKTSAAIQMANLQGNSL